MGFQFVPEGEIQIPEIEFTDEVELPVDDSAVLVIDMQNDFVKPDGELRVPAAGETVPTIQRLLENARENGVRVTYTQDTEVEDAPEFEVWAKHCQQGTWGWEIIDELEPKSEESVIRKHRYDAFYSSRLDHLLSRVWKLEHLVIVGTIANICVLHTAASAGLRYFHIVLAADGISALNEFDQAATLRQTSWLYNGDVVRSVDDITFI